MYFSVLLSLVKIQQAKYKYINNYHCGISINHTCMYNTGKKNQQI